uniref:Uncharacterized protein n=1 Tax=Meloidogyne incognita TaxID=6306 RepID=A0A914LIQ5_MELIC
MRTFTDPEIKTTKTISTTTKKRRIITSGPDLYSKKSNKENNKLELKANIYELGCLSGNYKKLHRDNLDKQCKMVEENYNKECEEENWTNLTICYKSKLDPYYLDDQINERIKLKNIQYSGRKCIKPGQHGLRIRVCARRISFTRDDVNHNYTIKYKIHAKLGFTYSHKRQNIYCTKYSLWRFWIFATGGVAQESRSRKILHLDN